MNAKPRACELCNQQASLYCPSDSAFLCSKCDATVHHANFLVARHLRHLLCSKCNRFAGVHNSGGIALPLKSTCPSCSPENPSELYGDDSMTSSSACLSSSESCATAPKKIKVRLDSLRKTAARTTCSSSVTSDGDAASSAVDQRRSRGRGAAAEVFVKWSRELGVNGNCPASLASHALGFCLGKWTVLPFRVAVATSFWLGLRFCGYQSFRNLTRLETISGVPAKLIVAAEAKLARLFPPRRSFQLQEGWAES